MQRLALVLAACTVVGCTADSSEPAANTTTATPTAATATNTPTKQESKAATPSSAGAAGAAAPSTPAASTAATSTAGAATTPGAAPTTTPAGTAATPPTAAGAATTPATAGAATMPTTSAGMQAAAAGGKKLAMGECKDLHTKFPGDEYCILPPPPDKGFQVHIGPGNYENPEPEYVLQPGEENTVTMNTTSSNDKQIYYYYRQYRMRPGSHHLILNSNGRRLGGTQNLAKDNPDLGQIAPENDGVGLPLEAHSDISFNMHYYNFGDKPIIREVWVNFWYKDPSEVKEAAKEVFSPASVSGAVAHSHVVVGASCPVTAEGRLLTLYGHRHLNNVRFSVYRNRGSEHQLVLEDYEAEHPSVFEFNSLAKNEPPNPMTKTPGAMTGILDIKPGDTIDFECEIVNMTDKNFTGANEAKDDEMCILVGDSVGGGLQPFCTPLPTKTVAN